MEISRNCVNTFALHVVGCATFWGKFIFTSWKYLLVTLLNTLYVSTWHPGNLLCAWLTMHACISSNHKDVIFLPQVKPLSKANPLIVRLYCGSHFIIYYTISRNTRLSKWHWSLLIFFLTKVILILLKVEPQSHLMNVYWIKLHWHIPVVTKVITCKTATYHSLQLKA